MGTAVQYYRADLVTASGGLADTWHDRTANALHLTQTLTARPAYNATDASYGGRGSLTIAGSEYMDAPAHTQAQPNTWSFVAKADAGASIIELFDDVTGGAGLRQILQYDQVNALLRVYAGALDFVSGDMTTAAWVVIEFSGAATKIWHNGVLVTATASVGTDGVGALRFGADPTPASFWRGSCAELGMWSGAWSSAQFAAMQRYVEIYYRSVIPAGL